MVTLSTYIIKDIFFQSVVIISIKRIKMKYKVYVIPFAVIILNMMPETLHRKETGLSHYTKIQRLEWEKGIQDHFL